MPLPILHIGNKNTSSWSMRPWLALKWGGIAFEERLIPLGGDGYRKAKIPAIVAVSPSGRVPALHADGIVVHESLAICEWAAERAPGLWPQDPNARALARAISAEMHSGFPAVRRELSMNLKSVTPLASALPEDAQDELARLFAMWGDALQRSGGPFLFGARGNADAMFAPVASRLRTYAIETPPSIGAYCAAVFADGAFKEWEAGALAENFSRPSTDERTP